MKKKHTVRNVIIVLLLLTAGAFVWFAVQGNGGSSAYSQYTAQTRDIVTYYTFSGNIAGGDAEIATARTSGTLAEVLHEEGELVSENEPVLQTRSGTKVKAPTDGIITDIYVNEGKSFETGDKLFRVLDFSRPTISIRVDEYDISAIHRGLEASVKVHATGEVLKGKVTRVSQEATVSGDVAYYTAEVEIPYTDTLHIGMSCEISILRQQALQVTTLPVGAIQYEGSGTAFVYVRGSGSEEVIRRDVVLGINNGTVVQIVSGLQNGESVYVPTSRFAQMMALYGRQ